MPGVERADCCSIHWFNHTEGANVHPRSYHGADRVPTLRGDCPHCLCAPCVIALPPDFLRGCCGPHPANDEKRYRLYRLFWRLLKDLGVWRDEEYMKRKEERTARDDRREIIPLCIIEVRNKLTQCKWTVHYSATLHVYVFLLPGCQVTVSQP